MKMKWMKRLISLSLPLVALWSLTIPAFGVELTGFRDVPEEHWAHDAIMDMVGQGMFQGTDTPVNGIGTFSPDRAMSRAEFITVLMRYIYPKELATMPRQSGSKWWQNAYELALWSGVVGSLGSIGYPDIERGELEKNITRQEAAILLVRTAALRGELAPSLVSASAIADYDKIGAGLREFQISENQTYVRTAYALGLLGGVDSKGTFAPQSTLTRAQAAAVIYRLVTPEKRLSAELVDPKDKSDYFAWVTGIEYSKTQGFLEFAYDKTQVAYTATGKPYDPRTGLRYSGLYRGNPLFVPAQNQTFVEGEPHDPPQVGDTVIKADGTQVVLKLGYAQVLGAGQGVDIYTNVRIRSPMDGSIVTYYEGRNAWFSGACPLLKCPITGEMYVHEQWLDISLALNPDWLYNGDYDGEICNTWYQWDAQAEMWFWIGPR